LYKNSVYDLHAIPTVYLLDKEKKVLLKDAINVAEIEALLRKVYAQDNRVLINCGCHPAAGRIDAINDLL